MRKETISKLICSETTRTNALYVYRIMLNQSISERLHAFADGYALQTTADEPSLSIRLHLYFNRQSEISIRGTYVGEQ